MEMEVSVTKDISIVAILRRTPRGLEVLLADRADGKGWNMLGGRVEAGETPEEAAVREVEEESGLWAAVHHQIGSDILGSQGGEYDHTVRIFAGQVHGGALKITPESIDFIWATLGDLKMRKLAPFSSLYPSCKKGLQYEAIERALLEENPVTSRVHDPEGLASSRSDDRQRRRKL